MLDPINSEHIHLRTGRSVVSVKLEENRSGVKEKARHAGFRSVFVSIQPECRGLNNSEGAMGSDN